MNRLLKTTWTLYYNANEGWIYDGSGYPYDVWNSGWRLGYAVYGPHNGHLANHRGRRLTGGPYFYGFDPLRGRLERMYLPRHAWAWNLASHDAGSFHVRYYLSGDRLYGYRPGSMSASAPRNGHRPLAVRNLTTGEWREYLPQWTPAGIGTYHGFAVLGSVPEWILGIVLGTTGWRAVAISRRDPSFQRPARSVGLDWLADAVENYGNTRNNPNCDVLHSIRRGDDSRYVYVVAQSDRDSATPYYRNLSLFLDFNRREGRLVDTGNLLGVRHAIVDEDGRLYVPDGYTPYVVDPFERVIRTYPAGSWREAAAAFRHEAPARRIMLSAGEMLVISDGAVGTGGQFAILVDLERDVCSAYPFALPANEAGNSYSGTSSWWYPLADADGNVYLFLNYQADSVNFHDSAIDHIWLGRFGTGSIYPRAGRILSDLGSPERRWGLLAADVLADATAFHDSRSLLSLADPGSVDPLAVGDAPDGTTLRVEGGKWRQRPLDPAAAPLPGPDPEGRVLGVGGGTYAALPGPRPLPDWFNGCTPVVDGGAWRAGDALDFMPPDPVRNGLILISRDRRWRPAALPPQLLGQTFAAAFPAVSSAFPAWYLYASGSYRVWALDTVPRVDGLSPGLLPALPDPLVAGGGLDLAEVGVTGNFNNNYWLGGDIDYNRPIHPYGRAANAGTGAWEPGDLIETYRRFAEDDSPCWHRLSSFTTVKRIQDYEESTLWGEEHRELFYLLSRFMSRMFIGRVVPQYADVRVRLQASDRPDFSVLLHDYDTDAGAAGWWFEHVDGGQTAFIPTGPELSTVVGIVFDPRGVGFEYDRDVHYARYKVSLWDGSAMVEDPEWLTPGFANAHDNWWGLLQVEDQNSVNHFVIPDLLELPSQHDESLYLFSRRPSLPLGGAVVAIPAYVDPGGKIELEIQLADGPFFLGSLAESRDTRTGRKGFGVIAADDSRRPWPEDSIFGAELAGHVHLTFDPAAAAVSSRVGTRFCRYRLTVDGLAGRWVTRAAVTTQANQVRLDLLNVLGFEDIRDPGAPVPLVRDGDVGRTLVSDDRVVPVPPATAVDAHGALPVPEPLEGAVTVLGHGVYHNEGTVENVWRHAQAIVLANRHYRGEPPLHEHGIAYSRQRGLYNHATEYNYLDVFSGCDNPAPYVYVYPGGTYSGYSANGTIELDRFPGSAYLFVFGEPAGGGRMGDVSAFPGFIRGAWDEAGRRLCFVGAANAANSTSSLNLANVGSRQWVGVWDRMLGSSRLAGEWTTAVDADPVWYAGDGVFLLPERSPREADWVLEPDGMALVRHGRPSPRGLYSNRVLTDARFGRFVWLPGKRKFYEQRGYGPDFGVFAGLDGGVEVTDYLVNDNSASQTTNTLFSIRYAIASTISRASSALTRLTSAARGVRTMVYPAFMRRGVMGITPRLNDDYAEGFNGTSTGAAQNALAAQARGSAIRRYTYSRSPCGAPGTFVKENVTSSTADYVNAGLAPMPGLACLLVPDGARANQSLDFLWWDIQSGLVNRLLLTREGLLYSGYNCAYDRPVFLGEAAYPATVGGSTPAVVGRMLVGGDVFPGLGTFKGDRYARLEIGQSIGR
jgi:hypothetical protein